MSVTKVCALLSVLTAFVGAQTTVPDDCENTLQKFAVDELKFGTFSTKNFPKGSINVDPLSLSFFLQNNAIYDPVMTQLGATVSEWSNSVDCGTVTSGPDMIFVINGQELHIPAKDYVVTYEGVDFCTTSINNFTSNVGFDYTIPQIYRKQICGFLSQ